VIREHVAGEIAHGGARLGPAHDSMPRRSREAGAEDKGAFREILGRGHADSLARVADESDADIRANGNAGTNLGLDLTIREQVTPAGGENRKKPSGGAEPLGSCVQVSPAAGGLRSKLRIGAAAGQIEPARSV